MLAKIITVRENDCNLRIELNILLRVIYKPLCKEKYEQVE